VFRSLFRRDGAAEVGSASAPSAPVPTEPESETAGRPLVPDLLALPPDPLVPEQATARPENALPGIIFNTVPKTGSVYILYTLARSLQLEVVNETHRLLHGYFPTFFLYPNIVQYTCTGQRIVQEHFDASPINVHILRRYTDRMLFQVRDPRQATLSWVHHMTRMLTEHPRSDQFTQTIPPANYLDWELEDKISWHIERHLPAMISFIEGWMDVQEQKDPDFRVEITAYERFRADEMAYFMEILDFYEIPRDQFHYDPAEKTEKTNFRHGQSNEWQSVLTAAQQRRAEELIGPRVLALIDSLTG
jgi:hypothetical protein